MAMIKCPECNRDISDKAPVCPNCGVPIRIDMQEISSEQENFTIESQKSTVVSKKRSPKTKKISLVIISILLLLSIFSGMAFYVHNQEQKKIDAQYQTVCNNFLQAVNFLQFNKASKDLDSFRAEHTDYPVENTLIELQQVIQAYADAPSEETKYIVALNDIEKISITAPLGLKVVISFLQETFQSEYDSFLKIKTQQRKDQFNQLRLDCPLETPRYYFTQDNLIGIPEISLYGDNEGDKTIDAFDAIFYCFNNFNEPVLKYGVGNNAYGATAASVKIEPGEGFRWSTGYWTMSGFETATKTVELVTRVHFTDGSTWSIPNEYVEEFGADWAAEEMITRDYSNKTF